MNRLLTLAIATLLLWTPGQLWAGVFSRDWKTPGDGLLTYDDVNQREWLDLTETQLFKFPGTTLEERYQSVIAQTAPGEQFETFSLANRNDVLSFAASAGINVSTTDFVTNGVAATTLIALLGDPILGVAPENKWAGGLLADGVVSSSLALAFVPIGRIKADAGVVVVPSGFFGTANAVWLVRAIPEPASLLLVTQGVLVLSFVVRRSR